MSSVASICFYEIIPHWVQSKFGLECSPDNDEVDHAGVATKVTVIKKKVAKKTFLDFSYSRLSQRKLEERIFFLWVRWVDPGYQKRLSNWI